MAGAALLVFVGSSSLPTSPAHAQSSQQNYAQVNGARLFYKVQGRGTPVLLIHGYPLSGELFAKNRDALARAGHQVITFDLRGFGKSQAPKDDPGSIQTYAKDALGLMDQLKISKAIIGGMSMGGPIAFEMYRRAPERFRGLILINTLANPAEKGVWRGAREQAEANGVASLVPVLIKDMLTGRTRADRPAEAAFLGGIVKQASLAGAVAGANALADRPDSLPTLGRIRVPTLILVGLEDTVYPPPFSQKMQQNIKDSKLVVVPGSAHATVHERAEAANQAMLRFTRGIR